MLLCLLTSCGTILGVDEYRVSDGCAAGSARDADGRCNAIPSCEASEVPQMNGTCLAVGVLDGKCGDGFERDPARPGGCREIFPSTCPASVAGLGSTSCTPAFSCSPTPFVGAGAVYVRPGAGSGASGTVDDPVGTIAEAFSLGEARAGPIRIGLYAGTYDEGPLTYDREIDITGLCPQRVTIRATDPAHPVIDIRHGAANSGISDVTIEGPGALAGIRAVGVEGLTLNNLVIGPVSGPGISLEDTSGKSSGTISSVGIQDTEGAGVAVYGSEVTLTDVRVVNTRPSPGSGRGIGIAVAPSASTTSDQLAPNTFWDPEKSARSDVKISNTRITGSTGYGVWIQGSTATLDGVSVSDVRPDSFGTSVGIDVEPRWFGMVPAGPVTLVRSVISGAESAGLRIDDARVSATDTTIHDIGSVANPSPQLGGCGGNAVRIRSRFTELSPTEAGDAQVTLQGVVIDDASESGVHVEGAVVRVEDSLIRGVHGCDNEFGDGLAAYGYSFSPSSVTISRSRVTGTQRAPLALFDADLMLDHSLLEGAVSVASGSDAAEDRVQGLPTSLCKTADTMGPCVRAENSLDSALVGFPACDPDTTACVESAFEDLDSVGSGGGSVIPQWIGWAFALDRVASSQAGEAGVAVSPGLLEEDYFSVGVRKSFTPALGRIVVTRPGAITAPLGEFAGNGAVGVQPQLHDREQPDARNAIYLPFEVCRWSTEPIAPSTELCLNGNGVVGVRVELLDASGGSIDQTWNEPYFFGESSTFPDPSLTAIGTNAAGYFYNAPPGDYLLHLLPPSGSEQTLTCELDPMGSGYELGRQADATNTYRIHAEAGFNNVMLRAFCKLE